MEIQLHEALDRQALSFLKILEEDDKAEVGRYDVNFKMKIFAQAQDWLARRKKLKPDDEQPDDAGVSLLREMLEDPAQVVDRLQDNPKFIAALEDRGWLREPPKRIGPGRPRRGDAQRIARFNAIKRQNEDERGKNDDSELQALLRNAQKGN